MKIEQVNITKDNILSAVLEGDIYLIADNRDHRDKAKNSGRLTFRQLKNVDLQDLMSRIARGEEVTAVRVTRG